MGGRGASLGESDGPQGGNGGDKNIKWGQPNTPMVVPAASIRKQIGAKGKAISPTVAANTVNPDRTVEYGDYSMNCQRCVIAYELNRRGYNVEAEASSGDNDPMPYNRNWSKAFKDPKFTNVGATTTNAVNKKILKEMQSWGNGSRAIVAVTYNARGDGHVFNVEYRNGELHYYDAQVGARYKTSTVFNHVKRDSVEIMRSDNLDIGQQVTKMVRKKRAK